jgi:predicted HTH transcriptional regulator
VLGYREKTSLEAHHKQILAFIAQHGSITQREYASISNRSLASRKNDFKYLLERDLIAVHGKGKATYYIKTTN